MSSSYQTLVDAVNQVEHDQSLFESQLGTELQGALHAELVLLGKTVIYTKTTLGVFRQLYIHDINLI